MRQTSFFLNQAFLKASYELTVIPEKNTYPDKMCNLPPTEKVAINVS